MVHQHKRLINISRGIKQGDLIAPFLFLLVVGGLKGLVWSAVRRNKFNCFKIKGGRYFISNVDDTLLIGEALVSNLWVLKSMQFWIGFRSKNKLLEDLSYGGKCTDVLFGMAAGFLHCRIEALPFKYLGLPLSASFRRFAIWQPMIDTPRRRLSG